MTSVVRLKVLTTFTLCFSLSIFSASHAVQPDTVVSSSHATEVSPYETQLFNLLMNKKSLADGKNHYKKDFDLLFDALLDKSRLAKESTSSISLKKRLLSGPQPKGKLVRDETGAHQYFYYEACQAHACDETNLTMMFAIGTKTMLGRLYLDGRIEYLGNPTSAEKKLLDKSKPNP